MTTSTAAHTFHRPAPTTTTTRKPSPTLPTSTAAKLGDCCSQEAQLMHQYGLQESPTRILLQTTSPTVVVLPVDDDQRHPTPSHVVVDPNDDDVLSSYMTKWCDRNDENFDSLSELDAIVEACERMQRRSTTATTTAAPTTQPTATTSTQQFPSPSPQQCTCNDEDPLSSAIDDLVAACDRMQQRWPTVLMTVAPPPPTTATTPDRPTTDPDPLDILASLAEFIHSDMDEQLDDHPPIPDIYRHPMSFQDTRVLHTNVMVKLIEMIGDINRKIDLLTAATTCPKKSPLKPTTIDHMIPAPRLLVSCNTPSPQQHTATGPLKHKGPFETLRDPIFRTQLALISHMCTYQSVIPPKPPFHCSCKPLTMLRTKDRMRPP